MLARPVTAVLGCRQCQFAIFRAVATRPLSIGFRPSPPQRDTKLPILTQRFFSQVKPTEPPENKVPDDLSVSGEAINSPASAESDDVPWFLEVEPPTHPPSQHAVELPKIPDDAPDVLKPMMKYIFEDMGLDDISLLDLRDIDPPAALGPNLIMLFGTARSERHLHISSGRFVRWLKRNYKINARADGLIGPGELRTKLRRLRKKAKLMGTNTAIIPGGDNGISTGWVCVNFSSDDHKAGEVESFDESGRFSGFGAPLTGTTVVIQCMTEARRRELDLEALWQVVLKKNLQDANRIRDGRVMDKEELDQAVAAKVQLPTSPSELQWQAMKAASQQKRFYSVSARRLSHMFAQGVEPSPAAEAVEVAPPAPDLPQIRRLVTDIQLHSLPLTELALKSVVRDILKCQSTAENTAAERLALLDQLLQTAEERGLSIWNKDMYVAFTDANMRSPVYGPELERAQTNLDYLVKQDRWQFDGDQIMRLMYAFSLQKDWTRFWDAFKMPPRFKAPREPRHYILAYTAMAATGNRVMCIEALRWVLPEMLSQGATIPVLGGVYTSLRSCIAVADPDAVNLERGNMEPRGDLRNYNNRRIMGNEFFPILRNVERLHTIYSSGTHEY